MTDANEILFKLMDARTEINRLISDRSRVEAALHTAGLKLQSLHDEAVKVMVPDQPFVLQDPEDPNRCITTTRVGDKLISHNTYYYKKA